MERLTLRATIIHRSFKPKGGAERVALNTIEALQEMGFKITLVSEWRPEFRDFKNLWDIDIKVSKVKSVFSPFMELSNWPIHLQPLPTLLTLPLCSIQKADLVINTVAEICLPYFRLTLPYFSLYGSPLISYIHIDLGDPLCSMKEYPSKYRKSALWRLYFTSYRVLFGCTLDYFDRYTVSKSLILTNSEFTKRAIQSRYPEVEPIIVSPPVDIETFTRVLKSDNREDRVLAIARISPEKQLENVIELAKLLPKHIKCTIVGSYKRAHEHYYEKLMELIKRYKLEERVEIKTYNLKALLELMGRSKVYFHTMSGEAFGITIVESMAAGLIPIVPDYGGQTEFVPRKYHYHTLANAAEIVERYINAPQSERVTINRIARLFSKAKFKSKIKMIVNSVIS